MSLTGADWEPALRSVPAPPRDEDPAERIAALLGQERYGVLATQGSSQPYASLLAFAASPGLERLVFATPVSTRKFKLLESCAQVSMLVDTRSKATNLMEIEAVTALGRAERLAVAEPGYAEAKRLLLGRHPHMRRFLQAPSCALFRIEVGRYFYVVRFQDVHEWRPR